MMTTTEQLRAAKAKIATPETWCRGHLAVDLDGHTVASDSSNASRRCMMGAVYAVCPYSPGPAFDHLQNALRLLLPFVSLCSLSVYNDKSTHGQVMKLFDSAIADAESGNG